MVVDLCLCVGVILYLWLWLWLCICGFGYVCLCVLMWLCMCVCGFVCVGVAMFMGVLRIVIKVPYAESLTHISACSGRSVSGSVVGALTFCLVHAWAMCSVITILTRSRAPEVCLHFYWVTGLQDELFGCHLSLCFQMCYDQCLNHHYIDHWHLVYCCCRT